VQTITIASERFAAYRRGTDFIQRHIFPGGMLPSPQVFERRAASADFQLLDRHAFGIDYAHPGALVAQLRGRLAGDRGAGLRHALPPTLAALPRLLRGRLPRGATDVYQFVLQRPRMVAIRDWRAQRVWIIGASSGIGAALAQALLMRGARVALSGPRGEELHVLAAGARSAGSTVDHADATAFAAALRPLEHAWNGIDLVVFPCAGTGRRCPPPASIPPRLRARWR
jgi:hypothetical protein